ncbi:Transferase [Trema orientale]|uniref:Transferase n=1 Tax=Trema orientale TaxID=63057 RepID=A0A2P5F476_TREOI|nr:Transferase [Trema orientale]
MAAVRVNGCYVVKPAEETWTGCLSLSELDQSGAIIHVSTIHFYPKPPQSWLTPTDLITTTLKQSLSRALVPFYPLAGRLRRVDGGHLDLDCNASGAQFIEAESESRLDHYLAVDYSLLIDERPVTIVQLIRLACSAISLCLCTSHAVVDGQSLSNFLSEWARLSRGEALGTAPFHDRNFLGARGVPAAGNVAYRYGIHSFH